MCKEWLIDIKKTKLLKIKLSFLMLLLYKRWLTKTGLPLEWLCGCVSDLAVNENLSVWCVWVCSVYICVSSFPPLLPPDVRTDTSASGACRQSPWSYTCPNLIKVCWLEMHSRKQRTSCHWVTTVVPPLPPSTSQGLSLSWNRHSGASSGILCFCCT